MIDRRCVSPAPPLSAGSRRFQRSPGASRARSASARRRADSSPPSASADRWKRLSSRSASTSSGSTSNSDRRCSKRSTSAASTSATSATPRRSSRRPAARKSATRRPSSRAATTRRSSCSRDSPIRTMAAQGQEDRLRQGIERAQPPRRRTGKVRRRVERHHARSPGANAVAAFAKGAVDAWSVWDPYVALAELKFDARAVAWERDVHESNAFYIAGADFVAEISVDRRAPRSGICRRSEMGGYTPRGSRAGAGHGDRSRPRSRASQRRPIDVPGRAGQRQGHSDAAGGGRSLFQARAHSEAGQCRGHRLALEPGIVTRP